MSQTSTPRPQQPSPPADREEYEGLQMPDIMYHGAGLFRPWDLGGDPKNLKISRGPGG